MIRYISCSTKINNYNGDGFNFFLGYLRPFTRIYIVKPVIPMDIFVVTIFFSSFPRRELHLIECNIIMSIKSHFWNWIRNTVGRSTITRNNRNNQWTNKQQIVPCQDFFSFCVNNAWQSNQKIKIKLLGID